MSARRAQVSIADIIFSSLSDFSDYDSSDEEYRRRSQAASRRQSASAPRAYAQQDYQALDDNVGRAGLLDPDDPFSDPFDDETPAQEKPRMECQSPSLRTKFAYADTP